MAADVVNLSSADTVLGKPVSIRVEGGNVFVNEAQVIITDIETSNGVIHVIDTVILPPAEAPAALPETGQNSSSDMLLLLIGVGAGLIALGLGFRLLRPYWMAGAARVK
jgi:hypothetical protein